MKEFSVIDFEGLLKGWLTDMINFAPAIVGAVILHIAGRYVIRFILKILKNLMSRLQVDAVLCSSIPYYDTDYRSASYPVYRYHY